MGSSHLRALVVAVVLGVVGAGMLAPTSAGAQARPADRASGPSTTGPATGNGPERPRLLDRPGHGRAVVRALGEDLPAAAAVNEMSTRELREVLTEDESAWLGKDGQLFYVEEAPTPAEAEQAEVAAAESALTTAYPESETFRLHSLPGSARTVYLDFDGIALSNTWWNASKGMPARTYAGFSLDGSAAFSSAEKAFIQQVWRITAEKFAAFDVDVTTEDPGPAAYNRSSSSDQTYGDHVVITDDPTAVTAACNNSCSGVALVGTFDDYYRTDSYYEPAWVFSSMTHDSPVLTAHTVAHEVGHTMGLNHDGSLTSSYYSGHGNWFPIMGSGVRGVGQWSRGEYAGATNLEDDVLVMGVNGVLPRVDDHGNDVAGATSLGAAPSYVVEGVISSRTDRDVLAVDHPCTDPLQVSATGVGAGASLDLKLEVLGPGGAVVASADPTSGQNTSVWPAVPTGMDAALTVPATEGTYYLRLDGVGKGSALTDGYSDYGSLGTYRLAVAGCGGTLPPPTVTPTITTTTTTTTTTVRAPSAPRIRLASPGRRGGAVTATARWAAPTSSGGAAIAGYRIKALRLSASGRVVKVLTTRMVSSGSRALSVRLPKGKYRFRVVAYNRAGASPQSALSRAVRAR